jgi:hypothetical protein
MGTAAGADELSKIPTNACVYPGPGRTPFIYVITATPGVPLCHLQAVSVKMLNGSSKEFTRMLNCRGSSLIRKRRPLGPYSKAMPKALWWSWVVGVFL